MDKRADIDRDHQRQIIRDTAGTFFVGKLIIKKLLWNVFVFIISAGGVDTTVSAMNTFILVMTCYPDIQSKAHEELDHVIVPGQLPLFEDEPLLPYITTIMKEVIRYVVFRR